MATDVLEQPFGPLEMGPVDSRNVGNYQSTLRNITEERRAQLRYCSDAVVRIEFWKLLIDIL
jgi:hypothetical protein